MEPKTNTVFIEFDCRVDSFDKSTVAEYGYSLEYMPTLTNAYRSPGVLDSVVTGAEEIWMQTMAVQQSEYTIANFLRKFFTEGVTGKRIVNFSGKLLAYLQRESVRSDEYRITIEDGSYSPFEIIKTVIENNEVFEYDLEDGNIKKIGIKTDSDELYLTDIVYLKVQE